ncbi:unnamed protein product, partial [marine sediment metagenome]
ATDPDTDDIAEYIVNWGDGPNETITGPFASGTPATANHTWEEQGKYTIKAKAKDEHGLESEWGTLEIEMPVNQQVVVLSNQQILKTILQQFLSFRQNIFGFPLTR